MHVGPVFGLSALVMMVAIGVCEARDSQMVKYIKSSSELCSSRCFEEGLQVLWETSGMPK